MTRALAIVLALALIGPAPGRAAELVYEAPEAAPKTYAKLPWRFGDSLTSGYWYSADQVLRTSQRIDYLEREAAKECVDEEVASMKGRTPLWLGVALGLAGGLVGGYFVGKKLR